MVAWLSVIVLTSLPYSMVLTRWPLHLAFFISRPALDRLADQAAAGRIQSVPVFAGVFLVVDTAVDPTTGNVGFITDPHPNGRTGLVRVNISPGNASGRVSGPLYGLNGDVPMGGGWRYQSED